MKNIDLKTKYVGIYTYRRQLHVSSSSMDKLPCQYCLNISMNHRLLQAENLAEASHHLALILESLLVLMHVAFFLQALLLQYVSLALNQVLLNLGQCQDYGKGIRGRHRMDEKAQEALVAGRQVGAVVRDDNIPHTHNLFQSERGHIGADNYTANVDVDSIPLVVCSPLGCIPRRAGIWGLAVVGTHRW